MGLSSSKKNIWVKDWSDETRNKRSGAQHSPSTKDILIWKHNVLSQKLGQSNCGSKTCQVVWNILKGDMKSITENLCTTSRVSMMHNLKEMLL